MSEEELTGHSANKPEDDKLFEDDEIEGAFEDSEDEDEENEDDDDEEYDEYDEEDEIELPSEYMPDVRQMAEAISTSGLLSQFSAMLGGKVSGGEMAFIRGRTFQNSVDLEEAAEAYLDAIDQDPEHLKAHVALGQVLLALDKPEEAITFLERASEIDPDDAGSYFYIAYAYYALQNFEKCVEYFGTVVELEPNHHLAYNNLGFTQYLIGDLDGAAHSFIKAGDYGNDRAYYNLGMIRLIQGRAKEGWQAYEDAAELDPNGKQIEDHLPDLETAIQRFPDAATLIKESQERLKARAEELGIN